MIDSPKALVRASLASLGQSIIGAQSKLRFLEMERRSLIDHLFGIEDEQEALRVEIKGLKDKAVWEMKEDARLHGAENQSQQHPEQGLPRWMTEGEEWKQG
jgi:hypothetical protein